LGHPQENKWEVFILVTRMLGSLFTFRRESTYCLLCFLYVVLGPGASDNPCDDDYRGIEPFSEVEVKNVAEYLSKNTPVGYMDIHAYSQLWMTPWGYTTKNTIDHKELVR